MNRDKIKKISSVAISFVAFFGLSQSASLAQLPPTNMGKFVHQPGDNQYLNKAQTVRHPPQPVRPVSRPSAGGGGGGGGGGAARPYRKTRPKPKPDISLQSIPAEEPIAPPGFPPLPEAFEIPGVQGTTGLTVMNSSSGSYGSNPAKRANPFQGSKQGYSHYTPGAFAPQKPTSAPMGGGAAPAGSPEVTFHQHYGHAPPGAYAGGQPSGGGVGYYKARSAPMPKRGDTFGAQDGLNSTHKGAVGASGGGGGGGVNLGASLKKLGREPKLNDKVYGNTGAAPEAPTPVQINQASTQDLSLPDDDFDYRRPPSRVGRFMKRTVKRAGNRVRGRVNGMGSSMMSSFSSFGR